MNLHRPAKNMVALQNLFFYFTEKNMWGGPAEPWAKTPPPTWVKGGDIFTHLYIKKMMALHI